MKTIFIPTKLKTKLNMSKILFAKLPKNIAIVYSVQYEKQAKEIKCFLEKNHKITYFSQVLGCSKPKFPKDTHAILLISDGKFHAHSLASEARNQRFLARPNRRSHLNETKLPIYILEENKLTQISKKDIEVFAQKQKTAYLKFLNSDKIGILISTKPGQENLKKALALKKELKNKKSYLFIANNIDTSEFENFGLNSWVNTACPRLDFDDLRIINVEKIK